MFVWDSQTMTDWKERSSAHGLAHSGLESRPLQPLRTKDGNSANNLCSHCFFFWCWDSCFSASSHTLMCLRSFSLPVLLRSDCVKRRKLQWTQRSVRELFKQSACRRTDGGLKPPFSNGHSWSWASRTISFACRGDSNCMEGGRVWIDVMGERALRAKCLPCKHKDLSLVPSAHFKARVAVRVGNPRGWLQKGACRQPV